MRKQKIKYLIALSLLLFYLFFVVIQLSYSPPRRNYDIDELMSINKNSKSLMKKANSNSNKEPNPKLSKSQKNKIQKELGAYYYGIQSEFQETIKLYGLKSDPFHETIDMEQKETPVENLSTDTNEKLTTKDNIDIQLEDQNYSINTSTLQIDEPLLSPSSLEEQLSQINTTTVPNTYNDDIQEQNQIHQLQETEPRNDTLDGIYNPINRTYIPLDQDQELTEPINTTEKESPGQEQVYKEPTVEEANLDLNTDQIDIGSSLDLDLQQEEQKDERENFLQYLRLFEDYVNFGDSQIKLLKSKLSLLNHKSDQLVTGQQAHQELYSSSMDHDSQEPIKILSSPNNEPEVQQIQPLSEQTSDHPTSDQVYESTDTNIQDYQITSQRINENRYINDEFIENVRGDESNDDHDRSEGLIQELSMDKINVEVNQTDDNNGVHSYQDKSDRSNQDIDYQYNNEEAKQEVNDFDAEGDQNNSELDLTDNKHQFDMEQQLTKESRNGLVEKDPKYIEVIDHDTGIRNQDNEDVDIVKESGEGEVKQDLSGLILNEEKAYNEDDDSKDDSENTKIHVNIDINELTEMQVQDQEVDESKDIKKVDSGDTDPDLNKSEEPNREIFENTESQNHVNRLNKSKRSVIEIEPKYVKSPNTQILKNNEQSKIMEGEFKIIIPVILILLLHFTLIYFNKIIRDTCQLFSYQYFGQDKQTENQQFKQISTLNQIKCDNLIPSKQKKQFQVQIFNQLNNQIESLNISLDGLFNQQKQFMESIIDTQNDLDKYLHLFYQQLDDNVGQF